GSRRLFGVMDDRLRLEVLEDAVDDARVLSDVGDRDLDLPAGDVAPDAEPVAKSRGRLERGAVDLDLPLPLRQVVDDHHLVVGPREEHGGRPAQVAVTSEDEDPHRAAFLSPGSGFYPGPPRMLA